MKKIIGIAAASAFAIAAISAPAVAAKSERGEEASCFGSVVHKTLNTATSVEVVGVGTFSSVAEVVQATDGKGQYKNGAARAICAGELDIVVTP